MSVHHLGHLQLEDFRQRFSDRDLAILRALGEHRFLTGQQIVRLHFHDHATLPAGARACSRVMERLQRLRTVTRLSRRVGGTRGGSSSQIWALDINGHRLLSRGTDTQRRFLDPSTTFLDHTLAIAETRIRLTEVARAHERVLSNVEIEHAAWRQFTSSTGQPAWLKPDLAAVISDQEFNDHWYIEVDLGTESTRTVLSKCGIYELYRRTGKEQAAYGVFPRVLWLTTNETRADRLRATIASSRSLHPRMFTVAPFAELEAIITNQTTDPGKEDPS
ncbi:replication-relaxation family protein [Herbiconiux liangxiaofengii]|uniref:replication-relaxation family protein n=1 Tax=Herbiconiux liangxiaofengii TaxID=3342795 RepID=UPI0035BAAB52